MSLTRYELAWKGEDGVERRVPVGELLTVGRGVSNDLVIPSERVSHQHARFWVENDVLWVRDSGSTNGTFVGNEQLESQRRLAVGDEVRLGQTVTVRIETGDTARADDAQYVIEDVSTGMRYPLRGRFVVGDGEANLRVPGLEPHAIEARGDALVLLVADVEKPVRPGEIIQAGQLQLRVLSMFRRAPVRTVRPSWGPGHYHVHATLSGRTPVAKVSDDNGIELEVEGETRATLLYVLAQSVLRDRQAGVAREDEGWMDDVDAVTAVWGRTAMGDVSNRLSVVVYRLRTDLKKAGLDSGFLERERGRIRVRAAGISLA